MSESNYKNYKLYDLQNLYSLMYSFFFWILESNVEFRFLHYRGLSLRFRETDCISKSSNFFYIYINMHAYI